MEGGGGGYELWGVESCSHGLWGVEGLGWAGVWVGNLGPVGPRKNRDWGYFGDHFA